MKVQVIGAPARLPRSHGARPVLYAALAGAALLLGGCAASPTYGTGTPAAEQLASDVSNALSIAPKHNKQITYAPRPGIVMPASTEVLPPPQENIANADNPQWPESPEERRDRLRAEATAYQDDPNYSSGIVPDAPSAGSKQRSEPRTRWGLQPQEDNRKRTREAFNQRLAQTQQGSQAQRRYLSEPPLVYRQPAATAPAGDVGEDEWKKNKNMGLPGRLRDFLSH